MFYPYAVIDSVLRLLLVEVRLRIKPLWSRLFHRDCKRPSHPGGKMKMFHNFSGSSEIKLAHPTIDFNMFLPRKVALAVLLPVLYASGPNDFRSDLF